MDSREEEQTFIPLLPTTDWNEEWKELQKSRRAADDAAYWDERSKTFSYHHKGILSPYAQRFLDLAKLEPHESVFDMGCGSGTLTCPLAKEGHHVIAADFSTGMLDSLKQKCRNFDINDVEIIQMSWEDNWNTHGIKSNSVDVAFASRSIATTDLSAALQKLNDVARRRICITLAAGSSPRTDERILKELGIRNYVGCDFLYAFMILTYLGYSPEVQFILNKRFDSYDDKQEAYENLSRMVKHATQDSRSDITYSKALDALWNWLDDNLVANENAGKIDDSGNEQKKFKLAHPRIINWAFIAWDKKICDVQ